MNTYPIKKNSNDSGPFKPNNKLHSWYVHYLLIKYVYVSERNIMFDRWKMAKKKSMHSLSDWLMASRSSSCLSDEVVYRTTHLNRSRVLQETRKLRELLKNIFRSGIQAGISGAILKHLSFEYLTFSCCIIWRSI